MLEMWKAKWLGNSKASVMGEMTVTCLEILTAPESVPGMVGWLVRRLSENAMVNDLVATWDCWWALEMDWLWWALKMAGWWWVIGTAVMLD